MQALFFPALFFTPADLTRLIESHPMLFLKDVRVFEQAVFIQRLK